MFYFAIFQLAVVQTRNQIKQRRKSTSYGKNLTLSISNDFSVAYVPIFSALPRNQKTVVPGKRNMRSQSENLEVMVLDSSDEEIGMFWSLRKSSAVNLFSFLFYFRPIEDQGIKEPAGRKRAKCSNRVRFVTPPISPILKPVAASICG